MVKNQKTAQNVPASPEAASIQSTEELSLEALDVIDGGLDRTNGRMAPSACKLSVSAN